MEVQIVTTIPGFAVRLNMLTVWSSEMSFISLIGPKGSTCFKLGETTFLRRR